MKPIARYLLPALCGLLLAPQGAAALTLSPMRLVLSPSGTGATGSFQVHNNSKTRVAVEFSMAHREIDPDGVESNPPAEEDFLLYPMQVVLDPDEARTVRLTWIGDPEPPRELPYRLICEQLPVDLVPDDTRKATARIRLMMRYVASVYILPKGARPDVTVNGVATVRGADGKPRLELVLKNAGTAHQMLTQATVRLRPVNATPRESKTWPVELTPGRVKELAATNLLPGRIRRLVLPWPEGLVPGTVQVELDLGKRP